MAVFSSRSASCARDSSMPLELDDATDAAAGVGFADDFAAPLLAAVFGTAAALGATAGFSSSLSSELALDEFEFELELDELSSFTAGVDFFSTASSCFFFFSAFSPTPFRAGSSFLLAELSSFLLGGASFLVEPFVSFSDRLLPFAPLRDRAAR
jgi:hypothetical protein